MVSIKTHLVKPPASVISVQALIFLGHAGGLSAEPDFGKYFDLTPANYGAVVALYLVRQLSGCLFAGPLADMYGRRFGMALGSLICIIGAAVQASSRSRPDLMAGPAFSALSPSSVMLLVQPTWSIWPTQSTVAS